MTRKKKIDLLKGIVKGNRSINELDPVKFDVWFVDEHSCTNANTWETITRDIYKQRYGKEKTIEVTLNIE